jgi:hypothetical protein
MPVVAIVAGVMIRLYYADHEPAHFHAVIGDREMLVRISDIAILSGELPLASRRTVLEWAAEHRDELALAWIRCRQGEKPGRIG